MFIKKGYKTIIFNGLLLIPAVAATLIEVFALFVEDPFIRAIIPPEVAPTLFAFVAAANIILRVKTTTPVFKDDA